MNVTLNIENDSELRAHIKDAIRGQVLSIVRDEILAIVKDEITRKIKAMGDSNLDKMLRTSTVQAVEQILRTDMGISTWRTEWIEPFVTECVSRHMQRIDWKAKVEQAASAKIKSLL